MDGNTCRLGGYENALLGYKTRAYKLCKKHLEDIDLILFGEERGGGKEEGGEGREKRGREGGEGRGGIDGIFTQDMWSLRCLVAMR